MQDKPLISIIIPVYNVEQYLPKCLESIINQTYQNLEIILVDDGATDSSGKICDDYAKKDSRIKVIHKANGGLSDARNTGIHNCSGDFILFIDSDDFIAENSLNAIHETLSKDLSIDLMFLDAMKIFPNGNYFSLNKKYNSTKIIGRTQLDVLQHLSELPKFTGAAWGKLISRKLVIENNLFFQKGTVCEDLEWMCKVLIKAKRFSYCATQYYYYRQARPGSITNTFKESNFICLLNIIKTYGAKDLPENLFPYKKYLYSFMAYEYAIVLALFADHDFKNKDSYTMQLKELSYLLNYRNNLKAIILKYLYRILGFKITSKILKLYLRVRK